MRLEFDIVDWQGRAPGLSTIPDWENWARLDLAIDTKAAQSNLTELPMMTARRLSLGSRLAVDCSLALLRRNHSIGAVVFSSRHGELERQHRILQALANGREISPTDFTMSVHNSAVGSLTIAAKNQLVASSVAAGMDTFQQGFYEVTALLTAGYKRVLLVDFEGVVPAVYRNSLPGMGPDFAYAVALVLEAGAMFRCGRVATPFQGESGRAQSLDFLKGYLSRSPQFVVGGEKVSWCWSRV